jgi:hypothetical protein
VDGFTKREFEVKGLNGTKGVVFFGFGIMFVTMLVFGRSPDTDLMEKT